MQLQVQGVSQVKGYNSRKHSSAYKCYFPHYGNENDIYELFVFKDTWDTPVVSPSAAWFSS